MPLAFLLILRQTMGWGGGGVFRGVSETIAGLLFRDAAFTWRPKQLSCRFKNYLILGGFAI